MVIRTQSGRRTPGRKTSFWRLTATVSASGANTALGQELFSANCSQCHGFAGAGGALTCLVACDYTTQQQLCSNDNDCQADPQYCVNGFCAYNPAGL